MGDRSAQQNDHAQGYAEAVARLRDDARYTHWWSSTGVQPAGPLRQHLADYLETVGPDAAGPITGGGPGAPTIRTLLGHQQRTSALLSELANITEAMATEMAQLADPATEGDHGPAGRLWGQLCEDRDRLIALLGEVLATFTRKQPSSYGRASHWVGRETFERWKASLAALTPPSEPPPG